MVPSPVLFDTNSNLNSSGSIRAHVRFVREASAVPQIVFRLAAVSSGDLLSVSQPIVFSMCKEDRAHRTFDPLVESSRFVCVCHHQHHAPGNSSIVNVLATAKPKQNPTSNAKPARHVSATSLSRLMLWLGPTQKNLRLSPPTPDFDAHHVSCHVSANTSVFF